MEMVFPGMDPYLENPHLWQGFHNALVVYIRDQLQPQLRPRYVAALEERVYLEGPQRRVVPDVQVKHVRPTKALAAAAVIEVDEPEIISIDQLEIHESYIEVLDLHDNQRIVTVIEVTSPSNKFAGAGRESYVEKQQQVLSGDAHLVEIDLLRGGQHVLAAPERIVRERFSFDYLTCVNRAIGSRTTYEVYPRKLEDVLPRIRIPLATGDADVRLELQSVVNHAYETGAYRDRYLYERACQPPLSPEQRAWAENLIAQAGIDRQAP